MNSCIHSLLHIVFFYITTQGQDRYTGCGCTNETLRNHSYFLVVTTQCIMVGQ